MHSTLDTGNVFAEVLLIQKDKQKKLCSYIEILLSQLRNRAIIFILYRISTTKVAISSQINE